MSSKKEKAVEKIVGILNPFSTEEIQAILESVNSNLFGKDGKRTKDLIRINEKDPSQQDCGGKFCPFWHWIDTKGRGGPIDGVCFVSGSGVPVMICGDPFGEFTVTTRDGKKYLGNRRTKECLKILPLSK